MEKNFKIALYVVVTIFALCGGAWGFNKVFATNQRVDKIEVRLNGVSVRYLREQLRGLEIKYGHTDCKQMPQADRDYCYWIKDSIQSLTGEKL